MNATKHQIGDKVKLKQFIKADYETAYLKALTALSGQYVTIKDVAYSIFPYYTAVGNEKVKLYDEYFEER